MFWSVFFAALYQNVTVKVKEGIRDDYFYDARRMERLDVLFAKCCLEACEANQNKQAIRTGNGGGRIGKLRRRTHPKL